MVFVILSIIFLFCTSACRKSACSIVFLKFIPKNIFENIFKFLNLRWIRSFMQSIYNPQLQFNAMQCDAMCSTHLFPTSFFFVFYSEKLLELPTNRMNHEKYSRLSPLCSFGNFRENDTRKCIWKTIWNKLIEKCE